MSGNADIGPRPLAKKETQLREPVARRRKHQMVDAGRAELLGHLPSLGGCRRGEPFAERSPARVDLQLAAGFRIDKTQVANVGQLLLAGIADLKRNHVVARGEQAQGLVPVWFAAQVRDDGHQAPLARHSRGAPDRLSK